MAKIKEQQAKLREEEEARRRAEEEAERQEEERVRRLEEEVSWVFPVGSSWTFFFFLYLRIGGWGMGVMLIDVIVFGSQF